MLIILIWLKKLNQVKAPNFKVDDRVKITKYKNIFSKGFIEHWSRKMYPIDSKLKTNPWMHKIKDLNWGE